MSDPSADHPFELQPLPGLHLSGEEKGAGRPLVLLHGLTATRRYVVQGSSYLARHGHRLISYDARGHGESAAPPDSAAYEYRDLVADLRAVLDELDLRRPVLVGSSMGATTALALALEEPERMAALVQVTPAYRGARRDDPAELEQWERMAAALGREDIDAFVELSGVEGIPERLRDTVRTAVRQRLERHRDLGAVAAAVRVTSRSEAFRGLDGLERLDLPVLVVASRDETDPHHRLAVARDYARRLPRARLLVEEPGETPLAWRGASLSRAIAEFLADAG